MDIFQDCFQEIEWCAKKGLKNAEISIEIAKDYLKSSQETIRILSLIKDSGSQMWISTLKYYAEYFIALAFLRRFGIKSEIHECTIKAIKAFEKLGIVDKGFSKMLKNDKDSRVLNQYYLKNMECDLDLPKISKMLIRAREILDSSKGNEADSLKKILP